MPKHWTPAEGQRLNPRKTDLHRWRETFAEKLRGWGIEAEATRQATRGACRAPEPLWRVKAAEAGRLEHPRKRTKAGDHHDRARLGAIQAWANIVLALEQSGLKEDRKLARQVRDFVFASPAFEALRQRHPGSPQRPNPSRTLQKA